MLFSSYHCVQQGAQAFVFLKLNVCVSQVDAVGPLLRIIDRVKNLEESPSFLHPFLRYATIDAAIKWPRCSRHKRSV